MENHKHTNQLINESSPYLLQHARNPVNWYPWCDEALKKAKEEDKLILVSIGYAACHWCHVMEKESFEDEGVADFMNEHFICIKVDREERPDIDQVYMEAVQLMTGGGGWPLNCFTLPDERPVYGGTYFRKEQWMDVLASLANMYQTDKPKMLNVASELSKGITEQEIIQIKKRENGFSENELKEIISPWKNQFDKVNGGNKRAPKFPMPNSYEFLLNYSFCINDNEVLYHVFNTLNKIASGGVFDQVGGGFARYSVDLYWQVPHFEKMLYDNAQLVSLYSKAYQKSKINEYKKVVYKTLEFIERELSSPEGAFYSSLDADSEGEEGKYYVWEKQELENILGQDAEIYCEFYQVSEEGNWEEKKNILYRGEKEESIANRHKLSEIQLINKIDELNKTVLKEREKRIRPGLDDKVLTSWNALMIKGYVDAYRTFDESSFLEKALRNANFILNKMFDQDFRIWRNYKNGKRSINAFLDDYALVIEAFITLYQATFDEKWLNTAYNTLNYTIEHFYDKQSGMFFYTSDLDPKLITRKMEIYDNVIPASNSVMAKNLYYLGHFFYKDKFIEIATQMLNNVKDRIKYSGTHLSNWGILLCHHVYGIKEIAISGENAHTYRKKLDEHFFPQCIMAGSTSESMLPMLKDRYQPPKTMVYICENRVCQLPFDNVNQAITSLNSKKD